MHSSSSSSQHTTKGRFLYQDPSMSHSRHASFPHTFCGIHRSTLAAAGPMIGSILYVAGSFLFFPHYKQYQDIGCWLYVAGIGFYLAGGLPHLLTLTYRYPTRTCFFYLDVCSELSLYIAKLLYVVGSVLFLDRFSNQLFRIGAWAFVFGSGLLCLAIFGKDVLRGPLTKSQVWHERLMMNWCSNLSFNGSMIWLTATFVYLMHYEAVFDQEELASYAAAMYLFGSCLFLVASIISFAYVFKHERPSHDPDTGLPDQETPSVLGLMFHPDTHQQLEEEVEGPFLSPNERMHSSSSSRLEALHDTDHLPPLPLPTKDARVPPIN